jgi:hypothetical protein
MLNIPLFVRKVFLNEYQEHYCREGAEGGSVTNVQYKPNWNCHYEYPHI